jgi:hypothetical protein
VLERAWLRRSAVTLIAATAGVAYGWQANRDTLEIYYAAAVRSMSMSWHDFIFGGFDPAGTVSLDKLPGAFWLQALAAPAAPGSVNFAAALAVALASVLVAPGVASADLVLHHEGALDTPFEPVKLAQGIDDTMTAVTRVQTVTALRLEDADDGAPDLLATQTSAAAAEFIYATGREVLPIGGFTGTIPSPTLSQLQADIRAGRRSEVQAERERGLG